MKVNILGAEYNIELREVKDDTFLNDMDGYCDKTTKMIVVSKRPDDATIGDYEVYQKKVLRHEIIHAFLFESGLHENYKGAEWGHDETMVDWVACQFPKMLEVFKQVGCL